MQSIDGVPHFVAHFFLFLDRSLPAYTVSLSAVLRIVVVYWRFLISFLLSRQVLDFLHRSCGPLSHSSLKSKVSLSPMTDALVVSERIVGTIFGGVKVKTNRKLVGSSTSEVTFRHLARRRHACLRRDSGSNNPLWEKRCVRGNTRS